MYPTSVKAVYFSPAGKTKKAVSALASRISKLLDIPAENIDITPKPSRKDTIFFNENDIVVFGMPVYAGRIPNKLVEDICTKFKANGSYFISVVTFGNRSFDNALAELNAQISDFGGRVIASAAVVCEHTFTDKLAFSRPNARDLENIGTFAGKAVKKLSCDHAASVSVPGDKEGPYYIPLDENGNRAVFLKAVPRTDKQRCINCKRCVKVCPMGSIDVQDTSCIHGVCIKCHACIKTCTQNAKYFDDPAFLSHVKMLEKTYTKRRESEFFV